MANLHYVGLDHMRRSNETKIKSMNRLRAGVENIGIENIARDASDLTAQQLASNAVLIHFLKQRYPEMEYLIGHDEYNQTDLPHYQLFKSLDPDYQPYDKPDPGPAFMKDLRQLLKSQYELEFME